MKKLSMLLAVMFVFTLAALAQESGAAASGQATSPDQSSMSKKGHKMGAMGASGKTATLTGCVSKDANAEGMYMLTNGRMKKGVEIGPAEKVKDHAGHQVKLSGKWASAAAAGETAAAGTEKKGERHFEVDSVQHIADTCSEAPGGGTMGMAGKGKKGKKGGDMSTPQNPQ